MIRNETDIAIIGAGLGGCIAALALAPHYSVTLIDKNANPPPRVGESLPPAAKRILSKLGLVDILNQGHVISHGMASYWGSEQVQMFDNLRNPDGMGWHVDRQILEQALREAAKERGVNCCWPCELKSSELLSSEDKNEQWRLSLIAGASSVESGEESVELQDRTLKANIVIDATGRHCTFTRQQGIRRQQQDKLVSVWMTYCTSDKKQMSSIHPTPDGWWYCAPIPQLPRSSEIRIADGYAGIPRVMSYQTDSDLLDKALTRSTANSTAQSTEAMLNSAKAVPSLVAELASIDVATISHHGLVAANSSKLVNAQGNNWFAVGDAAMSFDPLSSQGMFNAMASAMQLCDLILEMGIDSEAAISDIANEFNLQLEQIWQHYEGHKRYYYAQEKRWIDQPFWQRRMA